MEIEYEATFLKINKDSLRKKLKQVGAKLVKPEFIQKRVTFNLPKGHENKDAWLRVRDEQDKITMTYKEIKGANIEDQKEINLIINNFEKGEDFLKTIGCQKKSYQETKRELWELEDTEICIDTWPFLESFAEIEGKSEEQVKKVSEKLGFDYSEALFCGATKIYSMKYNIPEEFIDDHVPQITFEMENPFLKFKNIK